ncbi:hypothetical protein [Psychroserpens mesophilus]|uniref:hypothetical protein n=1 Tax=Psychroserpens mesophilus TaxID=325473 RepID=UPI00126A5525|nr:hypothetical protein [Psychroserpens mesophilus]
MKKVIIILLLMNFGICNSQKIVKRVGDIKISVAGYSFDEKQKKKKTFKIEHYYDSLGNKLESIQYGKHHFNKLRVIGYVEQNSYNLNKLQKVINYISHCKSCEFYKTYKELSYDIENRLVEINKFDQNDSLITTINYIYYENIKETHYESSVYLQEIYDSENRIIERNELFEKTNKIRWQNIFQYTDNCRIGNFQTFYGDGDENSKKEIYCYDTLNRIISKNIISNYKTKVEYLYSNDGFIKEVRQFDCFDDSNEYELVYLLKYKVRIKSKKPKIEIVNKINSSFLNE